jgi:RNA polymerase sigma-70 factor, ECF subfamily
MEANITASAVLRAIGRLPEAQRETILLVYAEGYSYAEAATAFGVPIGTIMSRLAAGAGGVGQTEVGGLGQPHSCPTMTPNLSR